MDTNKKDDNNVRDIIAEIERTIRKMQRKMMAEEKSEKQQNEQPLPLSTVATIAKKIRRPEVRYFSKATSPIAFPTETRVKKFNISCQTMGRESDNDILRNCQKCNSACTECESPSTCPKRADKKKNVEKCHEGGGNQAAKNSVDTGCVELMESKCITIKEKEVLNSPFKIEPKGSSFLQANDEKVDKSVSANILTECIEKSKTNALASLQEEKLLIMQKYKRLQKKHLKNDMIEIHKMIKQELLQSTTGKSFEAFESKLKQSNRCLNSQLDSNELQLPLLSSPSSTAISTSSSIIQQKTTPIVVQINDLNRENRKDPIVFSFDNQIKQKSKKNRYLCREDAIENSTADGNVDNASPNGDNYSACASGRHIKLTLSLGSNRNKSKNAQENDNQSPQHCFFQSSKSVSSASMQNKSRATSSSAMDLPQLSTPSFLRELLTTATTSDTESISLLSSI